MSANRHVEYATVTTGFRAPRVAVVFRAYGQWDYFARVAMYAASHTWGGAGFVLIPATNGSIPAEILKAVVAYDPDYVVSSGYTVGDLDSLMPGTIEQWLEKQSVEEKHRPPLRDQLQTEFVDDDVVNRTRDAVVAACSSYRMDNGSEPGDSDHRWHEHEVWLHVPTPAASGTRSGALTPNDKVHQSADPVPMSATPALVGEFGVAAAMRLGLLSSPRAEGVPLELSQRSAVLQWLVRAPGQFPVGTPPIVLDQAYEADHGLPTAWDATTVGLSRVTSGFDHRIPRLCVVGGSANDFALAMIWDRLYGHGLWLPDTWIEGEDRSHLLQQFRDVLSPFLSDDMRKWVLTSVSHDTEAVAEFRDEVLRTAPSFVVSDPQKVDPANDLPVMGLDGELQYPAFGKSHLGVEEQFSSSTTMPVFRGTDGSTTLAATPALPVIQHERLKMVRDLSWQIDIDISDSPIPPAVHVPIEAILHPDESPHDTWIRVSRTGLSYEALAYGFVPAGASLDRRLAKPRVKKPGMQSWAQAKARLVDRSVATSPAGRHSDVLQTMLGSRKRLVDVISGDFLPVFRSFVPRFKATRDQFPNNGGCMVRGTAYLHFSGIVSLAGISQKSARMQCDQLLADKVLSRGLLLDCSSCGNLEFVIIDRLRQVNECLRCGQQNDLSHARWKMPEDEPQWFYDLHPAATELMTQNGEVPILLASHLGATAKRPARYIDCAELEVSDSVGKKLAEADLLALVDDKVVVAEAKCTDELDKGSPKRAAAKRITLVETFGAEEVILATTQLSWKPSSIEAMRTAVSGHEWTTMHPPKIREITGLGTGKVRDQYVNID